MSDFIDKLQSKPEHVRRRILVVGAFGSTLLIAFIWMFAFMNSLGTSVVPTSAPLAVEQKSSSPFALLKESALRIMGRVDYVSSSQTAAIVNSQTPPPSSASATTPLIPTNTVPEKSGYGYPTNP